jgi:hypothetical protein
VGNDVGGRLAGCLARKNAKIPEVVKVNNYRNFSNGASLNRVKYFHSK